MRRFAWPLIAIGLASASCAMAPPATTATASAATAPQAHQAAAYIVRHLQKGEGQDPPLTAEGADNAQRLADMLKDKGIVAIYATPTRRAMETAQPLAARLGLQVTPYDPAQPANLVAAARAAGGPVLVVGHSNTVPDLVGRFGGPAQPPLSDADYGTVFEVDTDGAVSTMAVR